MAVSKYELRVTGYNDDEGKTSKSVATAGSTKPNNSKALSNSYAALTDASTSTATLVAYEPIDLDD